MSAKIVYNNTPSLVLLCENRVKLDPAGMPKDHAELTEEQQQDEGVRNLGGRGSIALLSLDEAAKRENRRPTVAAPSAPPLTSVTNPATPPPALKVIERVVSEPKEPPAKQISEEKDDEKDDEKDGDDDEQEDNAPGATGKGKKSKKSRRR